MLGNWDSLFFFHDARSASFLFDKERSWLFVDDWTTTTTTTTTTGLGIA